MGIAHYGIKNNSNYVITTDGKLLEIGRSRRFNTSVPTIFSDYTWTKISGGNGFMTAIQSNGTLWSCGYNGFGQLGLNTVTNFFSSISQVGSLSTWTQIACGASSVLAIQSDGTLWSWGNNSFSQLGLNTSSTVNRYIPVQVGALSVWTQVSSGSSFSVALQSDGTLWSWGSNASGQLGLSDITTRSSPVQVGSLLWKEISSGSIHTLAIQSDGTLWSWGSNVNGQLGLSDLTNRSSPVQVGFSLWKEISGGASFTLAIQSNGTLWAWGRNNGRQLGITLGVDVSSPNQVGSLSSWTQVAGGYFSSLGRQSNGTLWYWGVNSFGIQGNNTLEGATGSYSTPVQVGTLSKWSQINCFQSSTTSALAIQSDGTLWAWGNNGSGQLGFDSVSYRSSASQIGSSSSWSKLPNGSQGTAWSLVIDNSQTLYGFGDNTGWQMNYQQAAPYYDNSITYAIGDGQLVALPVPISSNVISASVGVLNAVFVKSNGTLWGWGQNTNNVFQIGIPGNGIGGGAPPGMITGWPDKGIFFTNKFNNFSLAGAATLALQSNGTLWAAGLNSSGQLGNNSTTASFSPVQVGTTSNWSQIEAGTLLVLAIQSNGTLWGWGSNATGQLGLSDTTGRSSPVQVGTLSNWSQVKASQNQLAIKTDGTLWAWGLNFYGSLGLSDTTNRSSPVQVGTLSVWTQISVDSNMSLSIQSDGTLWSWGRNDFGQLGLSDTTNRSSPVQVGTLSVWTQISVGGNNSCLALQSNGTLWAWGNNSFGQLGQGNYTHRSSPIQIGASSNWSQISCGYQHNLALQSDGSMWGWGANTYGQVGDASPPSPFTTVTDTTRLAPVNISNSITWKKVFASKQTNYTQHSVAISTTNDVYLWGGNTYGTLGKPVFFYSPIQIGTLSTWSQVWSGTNFSLASKLDSSLWGFGNNSFGQLGNNSTTASFSPVQISVISTCMSVAVGDNFAAAIKFDGTLWAWGNNSFGQLGQGNYTHRSLPVQVGKVSQYVSVYAMSNTLLANLF